MSALRIVLRKELRDNFRDRRSMMSALIMPLLGPVMFAMIFTAVARMQRDDAPLSVPIVGQKSAPNLVKFLERHGATVTEAPADYEAKVRDGDLDLVVSVPESYGKDWEGGRSAKVELLSDSSRNKSRAHVRRVSRLLSAYGQQMGALRLLARGISPALAAPMIVDDVDVATPEKIAGSVLGMIPLFLLMATFIGGMYLAIDATAGERERGTLEPLLINPVLRSSVVLGKWLAAVSATLLASLVSLIGFVVALQRVPLQDLGVKASLAAPQIAGVIAVLIPLALFAAALQMLMALFARSFKEAQTWLSLMMLIPTLPASILSISPIKSAAWMMAVPVFGQTLLLSDLLKGDWPPWWWFVAAATATGGGAALCLAAATRMLRDERIVFGRTQSG